MNNPVDKYLYNLKSLLDTIDRESFSNAINLVDEAWRRGNQIITMGNGGSALTSLHFINDWNKSIFMQTGRPFYGRSLVENIGLMMSYANDVSYQDIFIEQLKNILRPSDLVIAISGSGNSENIIRAVEYANSNHAITLGLCGFDGGKLKKTAKHVLWANIMDMQLSEDMHAIFGHVVMKQLCGSSKCKIC